MRGGEGRRTLPAQCYYDSCAAKLTAMGYFSQANKKITAHVKIVLENLSIFVQNYIL